LPMNLSSPEGLQEVLTMLFLPISAALAIILGELSIVLILPAIPLHEFGHYLVARLLGTYAGYKLMPPMIYENRPGTWQCAIAGPIMSLLVLPIAVAHERPLFEILILATLVLAYASSDLEEIVDRIRRAT